MPNASDANKNVNVHPEPIASVGWQDLCGITRVRGILASDLQKKMETGLGFPACGQAMTIGGGIVANRWGPVSDVRQIPKIDTLVSIPKIAEYPGFQLVLAESVNTDGTAFNCCTRQVLRSALDDLMSETGLEFASAFEHEFTFVRDGFEPELCMSFGAMRDVEPMAEVMLAALRVAGVSVEAFEPEFGSGQYELSCSHIWGIEAADKVVATREVIRDVARHFGFRATFVPKVSPSQPGNGAHIHFSLRDASSGKPVLYDSDCPDGLSNIGAQFTAGIIRHINPIMAFAAPTPVSYMRLGPSKWSSGFNAYGPSNREAVIRTCDLPMLSDKKRANSFNLEFRAADNASNPYLILAMLVRAGLHGIMNNYARPISIEVDPASLSDAERKNLGVKPLPATLDEALKCLKSDPDASKWLPEALIETFITIKEDELASAKNMDDQTLCATYANVF